jgi:uncharacterized membrane protein
MSERKSCSGGHPWVRFGRGSMPNPRLPNSIFFMLVVLGAVQFAYYAPRIPGILGSHFAQGGAVNAWQTKTAFFSTELAIIVIATVVSFGIPRLIAAMPVSLINLPHKEFWLGPGRRDKTLSYIRVWSAWFGCALLAFLLFVMELVFRANWHTPPQLNIAAFVPAILSFLAFVAISSIRLILHFSRTQDH